MRSLDYDNYLLRKRTGGNPIHRGALVVFLCALLCILGIVTYNGNTSNNAQALTQNTVPSQPPLVSVKHNRIQPVKQPTRARPTPSVTDSASQYTGKPLTYPVYYGNARLPEIALTFDDGPNPIYTSQILAVLQTYNVKATFFDVGYLVKDYPNIVRQEFLQGNSIGNHSWSHPDLSRFSAAGIVSQLTSASDAIQSVTGARPTIFRPPYGSFNANVITQAIRLNLTAIIWNDEARDWATPGVNLIVSRILNLARNGGIILLHDGGGFRAQTVAALPIIIETLRQRGYTFVTIPQLLHDMAATGIPLPEATPTGISSPTALTPILIAWKQE